MEPIELLIVEDDPELLQTLERAFSAERYRVRSAARWDEAWPLLEQEGVSIDVALLDLYVAEDCTLDQIPELRRRMPGCEMIVMTAQAEVQTAVAAMKLGAHDYLMKPVALRDLTKAVAAAHEKARLRRENAALRRHVSGVASSAPPIVVKSPKMKAVLELADKFGASELPVLILGETGAGKELVARRVHAASGRRDGPFIPINCATIPRDIAMAELFGHERGAFTGASERRLGMVELADGGTFFMDEVGDMPLDVQVSLLRFLETGEFRRVGGEAVLRADVRIIAATNHDLEADAAARRFRQDLLFRLAVARIDLPPLRHRSDDIEPLVKHFLGEAEREVGVTPEALEALKAYRWPGNVRELRNAVSRAAAFCRGDAIGVEDLPPAVREGSGAVRDFTDLSFRDMERLYVQSMLARHDGNKTRTARAMDIDIRTLYSKIKKLGI